MTFDLPKLAGTSIEYYSMCGKVRTARNDIKELIKKHAGRTKYNLAAPDGELHARVVFDEMKDYFHVHIDMATKNHFGTRNPPSPSENVPSFDDLLSPFIGEKIAVIVFGEYRCPLESLPPIIALLQKISIKSGGVGIRLTEAMLSVTGSPIQEIHWEPRDEDDVCEIVLKGVKEMTFSSSYCVDGLAFIKEHIDAFLKKGIPDASHAAD